LKFKIETGLNQI